MSEGIYPKLGLEEEKLEVCHQWLRLLLERVETVTWEASDLSGFDQKGVDLWVKENGKRIAVQCKTKHNRQKWVPSDLGKASKTSSVWAYIRNQLIDRPDPASEFWFSTNTPYVESLSPLLDWAQSDSNLKELNQTEKKALSLLGLEHQTQEQLRDLLKKIKIRQMRGEEECLDLTVGLVEIESQRALLNALRGMPETKVLGKELRKKDLRNLLKETAPEISWIECDEAFVHDRLITKTQDRIGYLELKTRFDFIKREETHSWTNLFAESDAQQRIMVVGEPGSGKSFVLLEGAKKLSDSGVPVLFVAADELSDLGKELSPSSLRRVFGDKAIVIIDQWDSLDLFESTDRKRAAIRYCQNCLHVGINLVVGCRAVDARDSQLDSIFENKASSTSLSKIIVDPLPEEDVTNVLNQAGISWSRIGPDTRLLMRNPECLGMVMDITKEIGGEQLQAGSVVELAFQWVSLRLKDHPRAKDFFQEFTTQLGKRGGVSIPSSQFRARTKEIEELKQAGILQVNPARELEVRHQILLDAFLAEQLGSSDSPQEFLRRLPNKVQQSFFHARRVRQSVSILSGKGEQGTEIMHEVFTSNEVRPLVKRGLLLGLAEIEFPEDELWTLVKGWIQTGIDRERVAMLVCSGRTGWMRKYLEWALEQGDSFSSSDRKKLIHWLASVSTSLGDEIAKALIAWSKQDHALMECAEVAELFWQSPIRDSDDLFQIRINEWTGLQEKILNENEYELWRNVFKEAPKRGAILLGKYLEAVDVKEISGYRSNRSGILANELDQIPDEFVSLGGDVLRCLARAWKKFHIPEYSWDTQTLDLTSKSLLGKLVWAIALPSAQGLEKGAITLEEVLGLLPSPRRKTDILLLLQILQALKEKPSASLSNSYIDWLIRHENAVNLKILTTHTIGGKKYPLNQKAMDYLVQGADPEHLNLLLLWASELENEIDSYRILGMIKPEVQMLVESAATRYLDLDQQYGPYDQYFPDYEDLDKVIFHSDYSESVEDMKTWDLSRWIEELEKVSSSEEVRSLSHGEGLVKVQNIEQFLDRFRHFSSRNPTSFFPIAQSFLKKVSPLNGETKSKILQAVAIPKNPHKEDEGDTWERVSTDELERWILDSDLLHEPDCKMAIAEVVGDRADHIWSTETYDRLKEIALESFTPKKLDEEDQSDLLNIRYHQPNTRALSALSRSVSHHDDLIPEGLELAESLQDSTDPSVKTETAILAAHCFHHNRERSIDIILACASEEICRVQFVMMEVLWFLICQLEEKEAAIRDNVIDLLLSNLTFEKKEVTRQVGFYGFALFEGNLISYDKLMSSFMNYPEARSALAWAVAELLDEKDPPPPWSWGLALELASDPDPDVRRELSARLNCSKAKPFMMKISFVKGLLNSELKKDAVSELEHLLKDSAQLALYTDSLIKNAVDLLREVKSTDIDISGWEFRRRINDTETLLTRLIEELQYSNKKDNLEVALDTYDMWVEEYPNFGLAWFSQWST